MRHRVRIHVCIGKRNTAEHCGECPYFVGRYYGASCTLFHTALETLDDGAGLRAPQCLAASVEGDPERIRIEAGYKFSNGRCAGCPKLETHPKGWRTGIYNTCALFHAGERMPDDGSYTLRWPECLAAEEKSE